MNRMYAGSALAGLGAEHLSIGEESRPGDVLDTPIPENPVRYSPGECKNPLNLKNDQGDCQAFFDLSSEQVVPNDPAQREFMERRLFNAVDFQALRIGNQLDRIQAANAQAATRLSYAKKKRYYDTSVDLAKKQADLYAEQEDLLGLALLRNDTQVAEIAAKNMETLRAQVRASAELALLLRRVAILKDRRDLAVGGVQGLGGFFAIPPVIAWVLKAVGYLSVASVVATKVYVYNVQTLDRELSAVNRAILVQKDIKNKVVKPCQDKLMSEGVSEEDAKLRCAKKHAAVLDLDTIQEQVSNRASLVDDIKKVAYIGIVGAVLYYSAPLIKSAIEAAREKSSEPDADPAPA